MRRFISLWLMFAVVCSACSMPPATATAPFVVASFSVLGDITQQILGEVARVETIVGPDSDTHAYEPRPTDSARFRGAAAVIQIGHGFEPWLSDVYAAAETTAPLINATTGIALHALPDAPEEYDPHVWHDVMRTKQMVRTISNALQRIFPADATTIATNTAAYEAELMALDREITEMVATIPAAQRVLVTSHDTFGYFAERYGFTVIGTVFGVSTEGSEPSASEIAQLVDTIRASKTRAVFIETMANPQLVERVAAEAGVTVAPALYTDALGAPDSIGATYIAMMRSNMQIIRAALQGEK